MNAQNIKWSENHIIPGSANLFVCRDAKPRKGKPEWYIVFRSLVGEWEVIQSSAWTLIEALKTAEQMINRPF